MITMRRPFFALLALALTGTLAACGSMHAAATTTSLPETTTCVPSIHLVCLTQSSEGKVTHVKVGEAVKVVLASTSLRWTSVTVGSPRVLRSAAKPFTKSGKYVVSYTAVGTGSTSLRATGSPRCTAGRACPMFVLLWQTTVTVHK